MALIIVPSKEFSNAAAAAVESAAICASAMHEACLSITNSSSEVAHLGSVLFSRESCRCFERRLILHDGGHVSPTMCRPSQLQAVLRCQV